MAIKFSKVIADLNVGRQTIEEFLHKKGIEISGSLNSRISDDVYEMLVKEFKPDMDLKNKSDKIANERQKEKAKHSVSKESREIKTEVSVPQPKILGKIDLDASGKPKAAQPQAAEPEPKKPVEEKVEKPVEEKKVEPKAKEVEPAPVVEPEPQVEEKVEVAEPAPVAPAAEAVPAEPAEPEVEAPQQEEQDDDVFKPVSQTVGGPQLKVVGKVDLTSINQQTRPRKKSKEEKRNERIAKAQAENAGKKKRKRIGKEKIDIESASNQPASQSGKGRGGKDEGGKRNKDKKGNRRPLRPEVSEEDVQRQMKETLARLTAKSNKKAAAARRREKREEFREEQREEAALAAAQSKILKLTEFVTANDLAIMMNVPINKVIATCMNLGVMVSINQRLDAETINIVADEFGFKTEYTSAEVAEAISDEEDDPADLVQRPPVVTVMGHVDHGKTSLLDYIRNSNVIAGEAGGITQHIGAYNVKLPNGRRITFLDTPGHEAFTAMRARGAKVTDIVIVIVAADDSVMPQTVEALNHASAAGVPIIFAINKIDKPGANPEKIKEELAQMNYLVEDWGGKYQSQDISAKKGIGVSELMEKVLLEADLLDLKANPNRKATGSVIESSLDKGRGYVATVLVDNGTLHVGDIVLAGTHFGKVKAMFNERNVRITESGPSTPVLILGLDGAPTAGDKFNVMDTDQEARQIANKREQLQREQSRRTQTRVTLEDIGRRRALGDFHELNIIVKGDVDGSIEALSDSLIKLSTPEVQVNVIHKAVGAITESDVTLAAASDAYIIGFQVRPSASAKRAAEQEGVDIRLYSIIYDAIEEVKSAMEGMLSPDIKEEVIGSAEVRQVYHISKVGTIAGAMVVEGKIKRQSKVRVIRDGIVIHTGELASLKRFKDDVKEVSSGYDCGFSVKSYNDLQENDIIEAFEEIEVHKTL
jgi:translation initiation factor IF-2